MNLLTAQNLDKHFGTRTLFSGLNFQINEGEKIALIGANGCGKTTLFQMITGESSIDGGQILSSKLLRLGHMQQHALAGETCSAYDSVLQVFDELRDLELMLEQITETIHQKAQSGDDDLQSLILKQHNLQERLEEGGGYTYKSRARSTLMGLGFSESMMQQDVSTLSGGEKAKVSLARMLLSQANLLLLDEPTNHLDMQSVAWLEDFLRGYPGAAFIISHDRYFLDRLVSRVFELEHEKLQIFSGNYSVFKEKKEAERENMRRQYVNTQKEIKRIEGIVAQQRQWNKERNIRTAESKLKQIARLEKTLEKPDDEISAMRIAFDELPTCANDILIAENITKTFDNRQLFSPIDLQIFKGDHLFLLGDNGSGKSTLLKIFTGKTPPDTGTYRFGPGVTVGYYDQSQSNLSPHKTILEEISDALPQFTHTQLRNALAAFLFTGDDVFKIIETLSGGERARVSLLKLMLSKANFLLLDEPTNHLDIASREALEQALLSYTGTLLIVSHDRYLINRIAKRIVTLSPNGLFESIGNYDDYLTLLQIHNQTAQQETTSAFAQTSAPTAAPNAYHFDKAQKAQERKLRNQIKKAEQEIESVEKEIAKIELRLCDNDVACDFELALQLGQELNLAKEKNEQLVEEWMSYQEELSTFLAQP